MVGALMQRLYGSDDLFPDGPGDVYRPYQSVNFVTAHDGFCLYDLVAYNHKHNEANGHENTDGPDDNRSWNCGWEGDERAPAEVLALRRQQVKNFFRLLMLSNGTPMFCAGDEFLNTQARQQQSVQSGQRNDVAGLVVAGKEPGHVSFLSTHDRVPQSPAVDRTQPLLARGRALVRRERPGGFGSGIAHVSLIVCMARAICT